MKLANDASPAIVLIDGATSGATNPDLVGGKAAGLAVMANELALPVPPAFAVTTEICNRFLREGWQEAWTNQVAEGLAALGKRTGRRFGDPEDPLLVSVRSGAPVSMPGMMDTLLNVGMTPAIRDRIAEESGNPGFAANTWLRFNRMFAEIVLGCPADEIAQHTMHEDTVVGTLAAADRVRAIARSFGGIPADPFAQVLAAVQAVFSSWECDRAVAFRSRENIPAGIGTAATVQAMVFGNLNERSGTGVVFTRDPATGANVPYGDYLPGAQGEDVVSGAHKVAGLDALANQLPGVYEKLLICLRMLEHHYRDMCDVEFTVSDGKLYILQTRVGRRSPLAAVRIAVDMANDPGFPLSRGEAVGRVDDRTLQDLARLGAVDPLAKPVAHGLAASPGVGYGQLCCDPGRAAALAGEGIPVILARTETSPADVHGMMAASALVTTLGGLASHAAVVARSWAIPAVCSLSDATVEDHGVRIGDLFIAEGEPVTVDGTTGSVYRGDVRSGDAKEIPELHTLREWAAEAESTPTGTTPGCREATLLEVVRAVQLKGLCSAELAASCLDTEVSQVEDLIAGHETYFKQTPRGYALTPPAREWVTAQLREERASVDSNALEAVYQQFLPLNQRFKQLVSAWQVRREEESPDWQALVADVANMHAEFAPLVFRTAEAVARTQPYAVRFERALQSMHDGDTTMLAAPIKDSYHTVWFEFHEDLITLTGRDRATEEAGSA